MDNDLIDGLRNEVVAAMDMLNRIIVNNASNNHEVLAGTLDVAIYSNKQLRGDQGVSGVTLLSPMLLSPDISGNADISNLVVNNRATMQDLSVNNLTTLRDLSVNGFTQMFGDLSANQRIMTRDLSVNNITITGGVNAVVQLTDKETSVTLNSRSGRIITNNQQLNHNAIKTFRVDNNTATANDVVIATINSAENGDPTHYVVYARAIDNGSFKLSVKNIHGHHPTDAITINFALITTTHIIP